MKDRITGWIKERKNHIIPIFLILFFSCLTYSNSLSHDFLIDDYGLVVECTEIRSMRNFYLNFLSGESSFSKDAYYRPIPHILIMLNYLAFGLDPRGYHVVNLILFSCAAVVLYFFLNLMTKEKNLALITSLIFVTHPINGMLVNYKTAAGYSVLILFSLLSMISLSIFREKQSKFHFTFSLFAFITALLCHEAAIVLPLYYCAISFIFKKDSWQRVMRLCWPYFLVSIVYFLLRLKFASLKVSILDKAAVWDLDIFQYCATLAKLLGWYISKLISLQGIVLIWTTPVVKNYLVLWMASAMLVLATCAHFIFKVWKNDIKSLAVTWMLIGFLPVGLGCFFQLHWGLMIEPHWLFFSSIGFFILLAAVLLDLTKRFFKTGVYILVVFVLLTYTFVSRQYNCLWRNQAEYSTYWLSVLPGFKPALFYRADAYMREGQFSEAKSYYHESLTGDQDDWWIYCNLGLMAANEGNEEEALRNYNAALQLKPREGIIYNNIGALMEKENKSKEAIEYFQKAIALSKFLLEPRLNLARIFREQGQLDKAIKLYQENLTIDSEHELSLLSLIELSLETKSKALAQEYGTKLLRTSKNPAALTSTGSLFAQHRYTDSAFTFYFQALKIQPEYSYAYLEVGKLYGNLEDFNRAILFWQEGWKYNPNESQYKELIEQAQQLSRQINDGPKNTK